MVVRAILFSMAFLILPFLIGMLYNRFVTKCITEILSNWISGFILCLGYFELLVLPSILFRISLTTLSTIYVLSLLIVAVISLWVNRTSAKELGQACVKKMKETPLLALLPVVLIALQVYVYVAYVHADADDAFFVATSTAAVETDTIFQYNPYTGKAYKSYPMRYVLSPFPIFTATLSKVSGIHPAAMAHTVLPGLLLMLCYGVYALLGKELFQDDRKKNALFLFFIGIISIFLYTSLRTQSSFMLLRIWQGKAFLASMLLPFVFYMEYKLITGKWKEAEWILVLFAMLSCCLVSSMGIMLGAIMVGIMGLLNVIYRRSIKSLVKPILCCIPNLILAVIYLLA